MSIIQLKNSVTKLYPVISNKTMKSVYIGRLVKGILSAPPTAGQLNSDTLKENPSTVAGVTTYIFTADMKFVPFLGCTFKFKLPTYIQVILYHNVGTNATCIANSVEIKNGGSYTFVWNKDISTAQSLYRLAFYKTDSTSVTAETIQTLIDNGSIDIYYETENNDVVSRNFESEPYVKQATGIFKAWSDEERFSGNIPTFGYITDVHSDAERMKNFFDYCNYIGVDAIIVGGDNVYANNNDNAYFVQDIAANQTIPVIPVFGNHDCWYTSSSGELNVSRYETNFIAPILTKFGLTKVVEGVYYYDIRGIRVLSINQYITNSGTNGATSLDTDTINAIVTAMKGATSNLIVCYHMPVHMSGFTDHEEFYDSTSHEEASGYQGYAAAEQIQSIIDLFITKASGTVSSVAIDFTAVTATFICSFTGHYHIDEVGKVGPSGHITINACSGNGMPIHNLMQNLKDGKGITQDSFSIVGIDTTNSLLKIARVGATRCTTKPYERRYAEIPFK